MRASFSRWLIQRRALRVALIAGVLPLGFLGIFSAAIVVLVAVFKGWQEALVDCAMALLILAVVTLIAGGGVIEVVMSAALTWLVAIGLGGLTGVYASLSLSIQAAIVIGVLGLMVFSFIVGDAVAFWEEFLTDFAQQMAEFGVQVVQPEMFLQLPQPFHS